MKRKRINLYIDRRWHGSIIFDTTDRVASRFITVRGVKEFHSGKYFIIQFIASKSTTWIRKFPRWMVLNGTVEWFGRESLKGTLKNIRVYPNRDYLICELVIEPIHTTYEPQLA